MAFQISPSPRVRRSPFFEATVADGVVSFAPYNHMLMPTGYGDPMGEYWRLIEGVSMWDVAVERQVEIRGPDAARLAQALVPRKVADQPESMGWYVPVCDHRGVVQNDPILLKLAEDRYWLSIADSDMLFHARAIAGERAYSVTVFEPDVSPLAIQGPKAEDVTAALLGDWVRDLRYFQFGDAELAGIPLKVARSGWSKQGGFELYLMDGSRGTALWNLVKEAGQPFGIGPGYPNAMERIESGLLSWGADTDDATNPYEIRMGRYVSLDVPDDTVGIAALRRIKADGPTRHQLGAVLDHKEKIFAYDRRSAVSKAGAPMGQITSHTWSPRLEANIGICLVSREVQPGDTVDVVLPDGTPCQGEMRKLPFI